MQLHKLFNSICGCIDLQNYDDLLYFQSSSTVLKVKTIVPTYPLCKKAEI